MLRRWSLFLVLVLVLCACGQAAPEPVTLTVLAAASLSGPLEEIARVFEERSPGVKVVLNFAGSQQLAQQLAQGAPGDVFASANLPQMQAAVDAGRVGAGSAAIFARNRLAVILPPDNPGGVQDLAGLARPGLKLVLAAAEVPAGRYSLQFLEQAAADPAFGAGYREAVLANVVSYDDNVRAVLTKVALGEADAGVVYASDAQSAQVAVLPIADALNVIAVYPIAPVSDSAHMLEAQAFIDLVLAPEGQALLVQSGFLPGGE